MTLKAELTHIVESQRLTEFLQTLMLNQSFIGLWDTDFPCHAHRAGSFSIRGTPFKESVFVFSHSGAHAEMAMVLTLLEEITQQPSRHPMPCKKSRPNAIGSGLNGSDTCNEKNQKQKA